MFALPEVVELLVVVVVVDVGEHLHDLGLFLFHTSDIQQKYSKFRDFQVICTHGDLEYILKIFWTNSNISSSVKQSYLEFQISKIVFFTWLEILRNYLQLLFKPHSQILSLGYSKTGHNRICFRFQTVQKLQLETAISLKLDQIYR